MNVESCKRGRFPLEENQIDARKSAAHACIILDKDHARYKSNLCQWDGPAVLLSGHRLKLAFDA